MATNRIQELVTSFMHMVGIVATREEEEEIWRAVIPAEERGFFNGFEEFSFTFDRAVAEKHRNLELIAEGSYLLKKIVERLIRIPRVSRLFKTAPAELPPLSTDQGGRPELRLMNPGKTYYRQQVIFNFKVAFLAEGRRERRLSVLADSARYELHLQEGVGALDLLQFREDPDPGIPIHESGEDLLRLYLMACRKIEEIVSPEVAELQARSQERFQAEFERYREFLEDQKRELLKKKENVCFHLYFFQKEEEIDRMIQDLEAEHERKVGELEEKHRVKVEVSLISAVILCIPTLGIPASTTRKAPREGVPVPLNAQRTNRREVRAAL